MNKRPFFIILIALFHVLTAVGQNLTIRGDVSDALKRQGLPKAVAQLISLDNNTLLATDTTVLNVIREEQNGSVRIYLDKMSGAVFSLPLSERKNCMLLIQAKGYEPYRQKLNVDSLNKKNRYDVGSIWMIPLLKTKQLQTAEVKATRIKMFYKGDTLIYNADAFNVSQNQMLRSLIEQLPGAEFRDGQIFVGGKLVENLLLSGKNFFNGNIQLALDNLPAFVVSKIKVYDKMGELSEMTGRDMHDKSYVMDVRLKRKYIGTWLAKAGADVGTKERFGGQTFLMRMDDRQMFTLNADINNFNQQREMNAMCNMSSGSNAGIVKNKVARFSYYIEPNSKLRFRSNASVQREEHTVDSWKNTETFLAPFNMMTRNVSHSNATQTDIKAFSSLRFRTTRKFLYELSYDFSYSEKERTDDDLTVAYFLPGKSKWSELSVDSIYKQESSEAKSTLLYSLLEPQRNNTREVAHVVNLTSTLALGGNLLNLKAELEHNLLNNHRFSNYNLTYYETDNAVRQRKYYRERDYMLAANASAEYIYKYAASDASDSQLSPYLSFAHRYGTGSHPLYRLDRIEGFMEDEGWGLSSLGEVPNDEFLSLCIDLQNSYYSLQHQNKGVVGMNFSHKQQLKTGRMLHLKATSEFSYDKRALDYTREAVTYNIHREAFFFEPKLSIRLLPNKTKEHHWFSECSLEYTGTPSMPQLTNLLPIRDASNPLNLFLGNTDLKNSYLHELKAAYHLQNRKSKEMFKWSGTYRRVCNDVAMQSVYNKEEGSRTYQPVNTSRTHRGNTSVYYSFPFDSKKRFFLSASFSTDYAQAEGLATIEEDAVGSAGLIKSLTLTPEVALRCVYGSNFRATLACRTAFQHLSQQRVKSNYRETVVRTNFNWRLPWKLDFSSECKWIMNEDYSDASLNEAIILWNASLSKSLLHEAVSIRLTAHDLLGRASNLRRTIDAVARTEWYTSQLPRYFLLGVSYRLHWSSKKK